MSGKTDGYALAVGKGGGDGAVNEAVLCQLNVLNTYGLELFGKQAAHIHLLHSAGGGGGACLRLGIYFYIAYEAIPYRFIEFQHVFFSCVYLFFTARPRT